MINSPRLSRFHRSPAPPAMLLTDRDMDILETIAECRLITREQVQRLHFTAASTSAAKRRLSLLYNHGYVERTHVPVRNAYGALRTIYSLDRRGADLLASERGWEAPGGWRARDAEREATFLDHHLDGVDVRIAFDLACRRRGLRLDWTDERELRRRDVVQRMRDRDGQTVTVIPDSYFTVASAGAIDGFALEVDRATVTERRMRARFQAYGQWAASGAYRKKLPVQSFRVILAVTDAGRDPGRVDHLKAWCEAVGGGSLFWLVDHGGIETGDILGDAIWLVAGQSGTRNLPLSGD